MRARPDLTVEQIREQTRLRVQRHRARRNATVTSPRNATRPIDGEAGNVTPSRTLPVGEKTLLVEAGKGVEPILAPFEARGYKHDPRFWAKMAEAYPALDLELEMLGLANWLELPDNRKKPCSIPRIRRWLRTTEEERVAGPRPANGTTNGVVHQPNSLKPNRRPDYVPVFTHDLERIDPGVAQRALAQASRTPLKEKLAQVRGAGK